MKFTIKNRWDGSVLFEIEADSFVKAVESKRADLRDAYLRDADLRGACLQDADLRGADLQGADLRGTYLQGTYLQGAYLRDAYLRDADLRDAYLRDADLRGADLQDADLRGAKNLVKIMGVEPGNSYWKRFERGLCNNGYQFYVGLNTLRKGEVFASDDRITCSYPGFHFASRTWCAVNYPDRPLEAHIRIPMDAQVNEPWATDGKASASAIEILQVFDVKTGEDVTSEYVRPVEKKTRKTKKD